MPTTITKTIKRDGSGDYTTIALWAASFAARNLVSNDEIQRGECFSDGTAHTTVGVTIDTGVTADATRYVLLTTGAGQSFMDNTDKLTDPLIYDAANGAAVLDTTAYTNTIQVVNVFTKIEKLQIKVDTATGSVGAIYVASGVGGGPYSNLILDSNGTRIGYTLSSTLINVFGVQRKSTQNRSGFEMYLAGKCYGCTLVAPSNLTQSGVGFVTSGAGAIAIQCAAFGFTGGAYSASNWDTGVSDRNAADDTSTPGGNSQDSLTYADQYVSATADWHVKAGSALIANGGTPNANLSGIDIFGSSRNASACTIGCEEFIVASSGKPTVYYAQQRQQGM
jgi:hypothetical protein